MSASGPSKPAVLGSPIRMGPITLWARAYRSGSSERGCSDTGVPGEELKHLYVDLARGKTPMIVTGYAYILENGQSHFGQNGIYDDRLIGPWRQITEAVHAADADGNIAMQIVHGGRQVQAECVPEPMAPSAVPLPDGRVPREMTSDDIEHVLDGFVQAARRAKQAGFDGVHLHAAHGYLISEFNSPHTNRRTDAWGGSLERRARFFIEAYRRVRQEVGEDFAVMTKMNGEDFVPGGLAADDSAEIACLLAEEGIDAIEISAWMVGGSDADQPSREGDVTPDQEGYYLKQAQVIKQRVAARRDTPVGVCGGWRSAAVIEPLLARGDLDFVAMSRPFICEPDVVRRLCAGQPRATCNNCNKCCTRREGIIRCWEVQEGNLALPSAP